MKPQGFSETPLLLNWRKILCATALQGLLREIAAGSEVVEITESFVTLRPVSQTLVGGNVGREISEQISRALNRDFTVRFTGDEKAENAPSLSLLEEDERRAARLAMIDAFKSDPIVQECLKTLSGTIDETSIRPFTETEIREIVTYERKHPGVACPGTKNAKKR